MTISSPQPKIDFFRLLFLSSLLLMSACKTSQPLKPKEIYLKMKKESGISSINIPVQLDLLALEKTINDELAKIEYDDKVKGQGLSVKARKQGQVKLQISPDYIAYQVPIFLWIKKETMLGDVEAEGEITLAFQTAYQIDQAWALKTETEVKDFSWNKKPVLKLGFVDIPISFVADWILNKGKDQICTSIDEQIRQKVILRDHVAQAWDRLQEPMLLSEEYKAWLKLIPQAISMSPLVAKGEQLTSTISMEAASDVVFGEKPIVVKSNVLPPFQMGATPEEEFLVSLKIDVSYTAAAAIANQRLRGERFSSGRYAVVVEDIELYGQGNKIIVKTQLSGSYKGKIYLEGKPVFNPKNNTIELQDLNYELNTKNFLYKSLSWLFHSKIKNKLKDQLVFPLQENISTIKDQIQKQLTHFQIQENILLKGELNELTIAKTYLTTDAIRVIAASTGRVDLFVKGLK